MGRNQYNKDILREEGFEYYQIGVERVGGEDYGQHLWFYVERDREVS